MNEENWVIKAAHLIANSGIKSLSELKGLTQESVEGFRDYSEKEFASVKTVAINLFN